MGDAITLAPNPLSLGVRALTFGLNNIENARRNQPGFPPGTEPHHGQVALLQEGGATVLPSLGSHGPSIYSQASGKNRVPVAGKGGGKGTAGGGRK